MRTRDYYWAGLAGICLAACGGSNASSDQVENLTGNGNGTGRGGGGSSSPPSSEPNNTPNLGEDTTLVTMPTAPQDRRVCNANEYMGQASVIDMIIMMDRSGSMVGFGGPLGNTGQDLWTPVGSALGQFVVDPSTAGLSASIQFYPLPLDAQSQQLNRGENRACDVAQYAAPAAPMGPLPANGGAIQNAMNAHFPLEGGTPTRPALEGAVQYARSIIQQNPTHKAIIVLATDGDPNDCGSDLNSVAAVAQNALAENIETYVIGIGNINGLNQIAQAGGTGQAIVVDADPSVAAAQFLEAMNEIRNRAIPCDYGLPSGAASDPNYVNLLYTPPGAMQPQPIPYVTSQDRCAVVGGGWYYDNPAQPSRILTCSSTCDALLSVREAHVSVQVGCATVAQ